MGKRGPPPTPTATLAARGSWRAGGRTGEAEFPPALTECPEWVPASASAWYTQMARQALASGYMADAFQTALALGAHAYAEFTLLSAEIEREGSVLENTSGNVVRNPKVDLRNDAWKRLLQVCREFGFTPSAKSGVKVGAKKESKADGKARFFKVG